MDSSSSILSRAATNRAATSRAATRNKGTLSKDMAGISKDPLSRST